MHRLLALLPILMLGCMEESPRRPAGESCDRDGECERDLVCRYGRCRPVCTLDRDCEPGQICVYDPEVAGDWVCTVGDEGACTPDADDDGVLQQSDCPEGLVCGLDGICRDECEVGRPCDAERDCAFGACVDDALAIPGCDDDDDGYLDPLCGRGSDDDCDDEDEGVHPGAAELCDPPGADEDCDGLVDEEDAEGCAFYFADRDGDGFRGEESACLCAPDDDYLFEEGDPLDCDDDEPTSYPHAPESCDGVDNDCGENGDPPIGLVAWPFPLLAEPADEVVGLSIAHGTSGFLVVWTERRAGAANPWALRVACFETAPTSADDVSAHVVLESDSEVGPPQVVATEDAFVVAATDEESDGIGVFEVECTSSTFERRSLDSFGTADAEELALAWNGGQVALAWTEGISDSSVVRLVDYHTASGDVGGPVNVTNAGAQSTSQPAIAATSMESRWALVWRVGGPDAGSTELHYAQVHTPSVTGPTAPWQVISRDDQAAMPVLVANGASWLVTWLEGTGPATTVAVAELTSADVVPIPSPTATGSMMHAERPVLALRGTEIGLALRGHPAGASVPGLYLSRRVGVPGTWLPSLVDDGLTTAADAVVASSADVYGLAWRVDEAADDGTPGEQVLLAFVGDCS